MIVFTLYSLKASALLLSNFNWLGCWLGTALPLRVPALPFAIRNSSSVSQDRAGEQGWLGKNPPRRSNGMQPLVFLLSDHILINVSRWAPALSPRSALNSLASLHPLCFLSHSRTFPLAGASHSPTSSATSRMTGHILCSKCRLGP